MSISIRYIFTYLFIVLIGISCAEDPVESEEKEVPQEWLDELDSYVKLFIEEGQKRGVSIDADNLTLHFVDEFSTRNSNPEETCGVGWWDYKERGQQRVEIRDSDHCWHARSDLEKENFMFHELGHALLSLEHMYSQFPNGSPKSIMCSNSSTGNHNCGNFTVYHQTKEMRDYYLDQLFDSNTSSPAWISNSINHGSIISDSIAKNNPEWSHQVLDWDSDDIKSAFSFTVTPDGSSNYQLEIKAFKDDSDEAIGLFNAVKEGANIIDCHAIKVEFDYTLAENSHGDIQVWIGIHREEENGDFKTINVHEQEFSTLLNLESSGKLDAEIYCVPEETNYVTITLGFKPISDGTITFSNIAVAQYD